MLWKLVLAYFAGALTACFIDWCYGVDFTVRGLQLGHVVEAAVISGVFLTLVVRAVVYLNAPDATRGDI